MALPAVQNDAASSGDPSVADLSSSAEAPEGDQLVVSNDAEGEASSPEDLAYARTQGWVEKDRYRGNPDEWVDATEFAERARNINPIINARNRELKEERDNLQRQLEELRADTSGAMEFARKQAKREYDAELATLRAQKAAAIDDSDGAAVVALDEKIRRARLRQEARHGRHAEGGAGHRAPVRSQRVDRQGTGLR
jgi:hypothetical protein